MIVDWKSKPAKVKPGYKRDEHTQAQYLQKLLAIFQQEKVFTAFVYALANLVISIRLILKLIWM